MIRSLRAEDLSSIVSSLFPLWGVGLACGKSRYPPGLKLTLEWLRRLGEKVAWSGGATCGEILDLGVDSGGNARAQAGIERAGSRPIGHRRSIRQVGVVSPPYRGRSSGATGPGSPGR